MTYAVQFGLKWKKMAGYTPDFSGHSTTPNVLKVGWVPEVGFLKI